MLHYLRSMRVGLFWGNACVLLWEHTFEETKKIPPGKHRCDTFKTGEKERREGGEEGEFRLRCKMDSYVFMNSVRKVKRKQYDNLAVIAFSLQQFLFFLSFFLFLGRKAESHILRHAMGEKKRHRGKVAACNGGQSSPGSSGGSAKCSGVTEQDDGYP